MTKTEPCYCKAYKFPHRLYGGKCAGIAAAYCKDCGEACNPTQIDQGIGKTEFWGVVSVDVDMVWVSDCCEADFYSEED